MQVVCERCTTAYDFPETNVPAGGVTVKCAGCGHRFRVVRVRRKTIPVVVPPTAGAVPPGEGPWTVRTVRGETFALPDISLLRGWIMERKVTRDDELANAAGLWRKLGSIPEYAGAFVDVDRSVSAHRTTPPIRTLDEFTAQSGGKRPPTIELKVPIGGFKQPPAGPPRPTPPPRPATKAAPPQPTEEDALEAQPIRRWPLVLAGVVVVGGLALAAWRFGDTWLPGGPGEAYLQARAAFLDDTETDLSRAEEAFLAIVGRDHALGKAGAAETIATRAHYRLIEAREQERSGNEREAAERKREATVMAERARRLAEEALRAGEGSPQANRALADALRVAGAPADRVEELLGKVRAVLPADPESLYVEGALRWREGKSVIARSLLEAATDRSEAQTGKPLIRADYLLASMHAIEGRLEDARSRLKRIIVARPRHGRAEALLEQIEAAPKGSAPTPGSPESPRVEGSTDVPDARSPAEPAGGDVGGSIDRSIRNDYGALIAKADGAAEAGRTARAAKLYQRALELKPRGVEALTGLGYCYVDEEKYVTAMATFKRALAADPRHGEAVIGMAESLRLRGKPKEALEYYRRYLAEHPDGPKAIMASNNVRDLGWKYGERPSPTAEPAAPEPDATPTPPPREPPPANP